MRGVGAGCLQQGDTQVQLDDGPINRVVGSLQACRDRAGGTRRLSHLRTNDGGWRFSVGKPVLFRQVTREIVVVVKDAGHFDHAIFPAAIEKEMSRLLHP